MDEIYTNRENLDYTAKDGSQMQSAIAVIENETGNLLAIAGQFGEKTVNLGSNYASWPSTSWAIFTTVREPW